MKKIVAKIVRESYDKLPEGSVFAMEDLITQDIVSSDYYALSKVLSDMEKSKTITRIKNGLYFKHKNVPLLNIIRTSAMPDEIIQYYKKKYNGQIYETGLPLYNDMQLTEQVPNCYVYASTITLKNFEDIRLFFKKSKYVITEKNKYLLMLLDCLEGIDGIPARSPNFALQILLKNHFSKLNDEEFEEISRLAIYYNSQTTALMACILDNLGNNRLAFNLRKSYSISSKFKLGIDKSLLKNQNKYGIA